MGSEQSSESGGLVTRQQRAIELTVEELKQSLPESTIINEGQLRFILDSFLRQAEQSGILAPKRVLEDLVKPQGANR